LERREFYSNLEKCKYYALKSLFKYELAIPERNTSTLEIAMKPPSPAGGRRVGDEGGEGIYCQNFANP
jgi:hypothetical protein